MVVKNFSLGNIYKAPINRHLINFKKGNKIDYTYLYGSFFIDGITFLPIEKKTLSTSLDLFTISKESKFANYFTNNHYNLLKNKTENIRILKKCIVIGNDENYYHNLILYLPKIIYLINNEKVIGEIEQILFNINIPKKFLELIHEILKLYNIQKKLTLIEKKIYLLKDSYCPTILGKRYSIKKNVNFWSDIVNKIQKLNNIKNTRFEKIYISRLDSKNRKIINEHELINYLKKIGFKIVTLADLDIFKQIKIFKDAELIIGYHGAGLANLVFSSQFTKVIEIHPNTKNEIRKHFEIISELKKIQHTFFFVDYKSNNKKDSDNLTYFDGIVNIEKFKKFLANYLN